MQSQATISTHVPSDLTSMPGERSASKSFAVAKDNARRTARIAARVIGIPLLGMGMAMWIATRIALNAVDSALGFGGVKVPWRNHRVRMLTGIGLFGPTVLVWMAGAYLWQVGLPPAAEGS